MFEDAHDNMVFTDPETGDQLIFHRKLGCARYTEY